MNLDDFDLKRWKLFLVGCERTKGAAQQQQDHEKVGGDRVIGEPAYCGVHGGCLGFFADRDDLHAVDGGLNRRQTDSLTGFETILDEHVVLVKAQRFDGAKL